ncbi:MAG: hypothetical protein FWC47_01510 [Oscillospiraceae bacterium]|nr:hypothetical protein [Oscillospiraceae bacterium]
MLNTLIRTNAIVISYELIDEMGLLKRKKQTLDVMPIKATDDDFFAVGRAAGDMLASAPKEILKSSLTLLMEG